MPAFGVVVGAGLGAALVGAELGAALVGASVVGAELGTGLDDGAGVGSVRAWGNKSVNL